MLSRRSVASHADAVISLYIEGKLNLATAWEQYLKSLGTRPYDQFHTLGPSSYSTSRFGQWRSGRRPIPRNVARVMRQQIIRWAVENYSNQPDVLVEMLS